MSRATNSSPHKKDQSSGVRRKRNRPFKKANHHSSSRELRAALIEQAISNILVIKAPRSPLADTPTVFIYSNLALYIELIKRLQKSAPYQTKLEFRRLQNALNRKFMEFEGRALWSQVKKHFLAQLDEAHSMHRWTAADSPFALKIMEITFVELIKNSFDAKIQQLMENNLRSPHLKIKISLSLSEKMSIMVDDNGPGFSKKYLEKFDEYIRDKAYLGPCISTKHSGDFPIYFGGAGKGLNQLYARLLDGYELTHHAPIPFYDVKLGQNMIKIGHSTMGGAQVIIQTPTSPIKTLNPFADRLDGVAKIPAVLAAGKPEELEEAETKRPALIIPEEASPKISPLSFFPKKVPQLDPKMSAFTHSLGR